MTSKVSSKNVGHADIDAFVTAPTSLERLSLLKKWTQDGYKLDAQVLRGLMAMPISYDEIVACLEICSTEDPDEFELWIMNNFLSWPQNIAAAALHAWARTTNRILWHRLLPILSIPELPQRIRYTILDVGAQSHGYEVTKAMISSGGWEDLSPAFHALLFERALRYDISSERLSKLAWKILDQNAANNHPEDKSLFPAIGWLCRHDEKKLNKWYQNAPMSIWTDLVKVVLDSQSTRSSAFTKFEKSQAKSASESLSAKKLPPLWSRDVITSEFFSSFIQNLKMDNISIDGFPQSVIQNYGGSIHTSWIDDLIAHTPFVHATQFSTEGVTHFAKSYDAKEFPTLFKARSLSTKGTGGIASDGINQRCDFSVETNRNEKYFHPIQDLFRAFERQSANSNNSNRVENVWQLLAEAWKNPSNADLGAIASFTRKDRGLLALAHIMLLSKMVGRDDAVLKLLDYVRSSEEVELRAVVHALGKINTARSLLELIAMLTRPNATIAVQQDILSVLQGKNLKGLQKELRSAVNDLRLPANTDHPIYQIRDELSAMLETTPDEANADRLTPPTTQSTHTKDGNLDIELGAMIPHYAVLSSEVKRALRTALFFNKNVLGSHHAQSIDLSPLIDMQYKAMELLFREFFEDAVSQSLQRGTIQRKLDVIGYARPIVKNMDEFEAYIASLPVVRDIPFFSKFKLRKMLRAICQFEPGKRFTLDGLKAFGLYFLVFGRQSCRHGLSGLFQVGAKNDLELAEFCKELHIFQDFRNRAAHEGFHPDASNDVMGIWRTTASVVQWAFRIKDAQKTARPIPEKNAS